MKLTKTQLDLITWLYNEHLESGITRGLRQADAALRLAQDYPDMFDCEQYGERYKTQYSFKIKKLGYVPDFLKQHGYY